MIFVHSYMYYVHQQDVGLPSYVSNKIPRPCFMLHTDFTVVLMADEAAIQVQCFTTVWIHSRGVRLLCFLMKSIPLLTTLM